MYFISTSREHLFLIHAVYNIFTRYHCIAYLHRWFLPNFIIVMNTTLDYFYASWTPVTTMYNVRVSSEMGLLFTISTYGSSMRFNLTNSDYCFTFSVCQTTSITFRIGNVD